MKNKLDFSCSVLLGGDGRGSIFDSGGKRKIQRWVARAIVVNLIKEGVSTHLELGNSEWFVNDFLREQQLSHEKDICLECVEFKLTSFTERLELAEKLGIDFRELRR